MSDSKLIFEDSANEAISLIEDTGRHVFLTGVAGTGKSTLVRHIIQHSHKPAIIVAPTGIAAVNIGGSTIHSMLGIPMGMYIHGGMSNDIPFSAFDREDLYKSSVKISRVKKMAIRKARLLIIDEVSMLRSDLLDAAEQMLRIIRNSKKPFGGLQILFVGDMLQLPPVLPDYEHSFLMDQYDSEFFFDAKSYDQLDVRMILLTKIHRQTDRDFIRILNNLRVMMLGDEDVAALNARVKGGSLTPEHGVYITTHNYKADIINDRMISRIDAPAHVHFAEVEGYFNTNNVLAYETLTLKKGMKVMTLINNGSEYFNGKIGTITNDPENEVRVRFDDDSVAVIDKHKWENVIMEYDLAAGKMRKNVIGTFIQYPVKPAYAITIHKSQGLSFDRAILDINEVFASGQAYTALSRLRTLEGLTLMYPMSTDVQIRMNPRLINFIRS